MLSVQIVNTVFMIVPNAYILLEDCQWFSDLSRASALIKWTCWDVLFMIFLVSARNNNIWVGKDGELSSHIKEVII